MSIWSHPLTSMLRAMAVFVPAHLVLSYQLLVHSAQAQVISDGSTPTHVGSCGSRCVIEGGTRHGGNLFHSFQEFNVNQGQHLHFDNAAAIESILTRVTGENMSSIDGLLSVNGRTNLFLLNPNGILFGDGARLNIGGSFVATTAERFIFPDGSEFSAVNPQAPPLLSVNVPVGLQYGAHPGPIANRGMLSVGGDLTLQAGGLDLQGQLNAGGNVTLHGWNSLDLRDEADQAAILTAGGTILLQGDRLTLDALTHPDSHIHATEDITLRSSHPIESSAALQAGGSIRFESALGELTSVVSPTGTILHAGESVQLGGYRGASLDIVAGRGVTVDGDVTMTGARTARPTTTESIRLSSGDRIQLNGSSRPTISIRAGRQGLRSGSAIRIRGDITNPGGDVFLTNQHGLQRHPGHHRPRRHRQHQNRIVVQDIATGTRTPNQDAGHIILDAQGSIRAQDLDASLWVWFVQDSVTAGNGGDIYVLTEHGNIRANDLSAYSTIVSYESIFDPYPILSVPDPLPPPLRNTVIRAGNGGAIHLRAPSGSIRARMIFTDSGLSLETSLVTRGLLESTLSAGHGGDVSATTINGDIDIRHGINTDSSLRMGYATRIEQSTVETGNGGAITLHSGAGDIRTGRLHSAAEMDARLRFIGPDNPDIFIPETTAFLGSSFATGNAGAIHVEALGGTITVEDAVAFSLVSVGDVFRSDDIRVQAGRGGDIHLVAGNEFLGRQTMLSRRLPRFLRRDETVSLVSFSSAQLFTSTSDRVFVGAGDGGTVHISSGEGDTFIGQVVTASNAEQRTSLLTVDLRDQSRDEVFVPLSPRSFMATGQGGQIQLYAANGSIHTGDLNASSRNMFGNTANGGHVTIRASQDISVGSVNTTSQAASGDISIAANRDVHLGGRFRTPRRVPLRTLQSAVITTDVFGDEDGGDITVTGRTITIADGSQLSASTFGQGNGGNVSLEAEVITLSGTADRAPRPLITRGFTSSILISESPIAASGTMGVSESGIERFILPRTTTFVESIHPDTRAVELLPIRPQFTTFPSGVFTQTGPGVSGNAGDIVIRANRLRVDEGAAIAATTFGAGDAGDITIHANRGVIGNGSGGSILSGTAAAALGSSGAIQILGDDLVLDNARILTETSSGQGGAITLSPQNSLLLRRGSHISTTAGTEQVGGDGGNITIATDRLIAIPNQDNDITANAFSGRGGTIRISAETLFGIEPRVAIPGNGTNDIDASSQLSESGRIIFNNPSGNDPIARLTELPDELTNATQQVATTCPTNGDIAAEIGEFILTGRGGIPANPADIIGGSLLDSRLATFSEDTPTMEPEVFVRIPDPIPQTDVFPLHASAPSFLMPSTRQREQQTLPEHAPSSTLPPIIEAQGWTRDAQGNIALTANPSHIAITPLSAGDCSSITNPYQSRE